MLPVAHGSRRCGEQATGLRIFVAAFAFSLALATFVAVPLFASALMGAPISAYGAWRDRRRPAPVHA